MTIPQNSRPRSAGDYLDPMALQPLTSALLECITPAEVVAVVVECGVSVLQARAGLVGLITPGGENIEIIRTQGYPSAVLDGWYRFPLAARL